jgi:hypothetical protein
VRAKTAGRSDGLDLAVVDGYLDFERAVRIRDRADKSRSDRASQFGAVTDAVRVVRSGETRTAASRDTSRGTSADRSGTSVGESRGTSGVRSETRARASWRSLGVASARMRAKQILFTPDVL